ncbi:hypothetical protein B0E33_20755 [Roseibium algicola]|uniref:Uncharacterized protein n=1 Tax=Roseibium algicola TaxID=2857014 RepID=A0ABM6I5K5_9HYPH|nr:hypothetical protein B0E33_20755 [Roseibium aggregatum]
MLLVKICCAFESCQDVFLTGSFKAWVLALAELVAPVSQATKIDAINDRKPSILRLVISAILHRIFKTDLAFYDTFIR